jgi:hypothetical protein
MKPGSRFNIDDFLVENSVASDILMQFKGTISEKKSDRIIDDMEMLFDEREKLIRKRILIASLEILQNVSQHNEFPLYPSVFLAVRTKQGFRIDCGNAISIQRRALIEKLIRDVNRKVAINDKETYKKALEDSEVSGRGLGLLEIRRKAGMPLDFAFTVIDNDTYFFHFIVKFNMSV